MARTRVDIEGVPELRRALEDLAKLGGSRQRQQAIQGAMKEAAKPMVADAKAMVPVGDGLRPKHGEKVARKRKHLRDTIVFALKRHGAVVYRRAGAFVGYVGPGPSAHAHLIEFGTAQRVQTTTGRRTGHTPAHPYLRPAYETNKAQFIETFGRVIWLHIKKVAERNAARRAKKG